MNEFTLPVAGLVGLVMLVVIVAVVAFDLIKNRLESYDD